MPKAARPQTFSFCCNNRKGMDRAGQLWRVSVGLALVPGALQLLGFAFLPESPRWLCGNGKQEEAREVLSTLRQSAGDVEHEIEAVSREIEAVQAARRKLGLPPSARVALSSSTDDASGRGASADDDEAPDDSTSSWAEQKVRQVSLLDLAVYWRHPPVRRAMILGVMLMAMNQFSGINTVMYYSVEMMKMAGFSSERAVLIACLCDFAQMAGVCYSLVRMDVDGRRHLALQSTVLVAPTLLMLSISFWAGSGWLAFLGLMLYLPAFGSGLSGVPWTVNSEIYPIDVRSLAVTQATALNWFFNSIVSFTFVSLSSSIGTGNTFLIYFVCSVLGGAWIYKHMPETMGLGLEEAGHLFDTDAAGRPLWHPRSLRELLTQRSYEKVQTKA
uniref:Hexose transporter 1 n=1 Tax=Pinguiococcus pyrenoidosus TaxID=172671 RepID=A0A7R9YBQ0_9STRA|mmetsp:Transcript_18743/g.70917  ORF Transcript_18743/g.70917 Transcript_18743/m.70917 type:complete len:387 (+) Transcript_18743:229-1389(+)